MWWVRAHCRALLLGIYRCSVLFSALASALLLEFGAMVCVWVAQNGSLSLAMMLLSKTLLPG